MLAAKNSQRIVRVSLMGGKRSLLVSEDEWPARMRSFSLIGDSDVRIRAPRPGRGPLEAWAAQHVRLHLV
ncbi:hypothetical protein [Massilia sp. WF1]|uniref:hypothetical protein n=1 Tax=Massilia sp. WF1 TaxID=1406431 RepID=UPI000AA4339E|nr:hypothetical protein [Massilia sp. WF1]